MNGRVVEYLIYAPISVLLTIWVATTLLRHGRRFLLILTSVRRRSLQPAQPPAAPPPGWQPVPR